MAIREYSVHTGPKRQGFGIFVMRQFQFLGWKIWLCQGTLLAVLCAVLFSMFGNRDVLYMERNLPVFLSGCSGVIVLSAFPMLKRAIRCRMFETEQAAFFSGAGCLMAQLLFIAAGDICMLLILAFFAVRFQVSGNILFISLVIPFLTAATSVLMLWMRYRKAFFQAVGTSCCLLPAVVVAWLVRSCSEAFSAQWMWSWIGISAVCIVLLAMQCRKIILQNDMEKLLVA